MKTIPVTLLAGALVFAAAAADAQQKPVRIRGTITAFDGTTLSIQSRDGKALRLRMTDKSTVAAAKAIKLTDLKKGDYVGSTTVKNADGVLVAREVHRIPRSVKEGHGPWDSLPDSMMTNASVASVVPVTGGEQLTLEYSGGSQKILVPPGTPIVMTAPADRSFLKPGEYVFVAAQAGADGTLTALRIQVSHGGVKPPQ